MAYRKRHSRRKAALSKRQARAVVAITKRQIETKHYVIRNTFGNYLNSAGYVAPQSSYAFFFNLFSFIPREVVTPSDSFHTVVGQQFDARGCKLSLNLYSATGAQLDLHGRVTFYKTNNYVDNAGGLGNLPNVLSTGGDPFDLEGPTGPTIAKWDPQHVQIIKQHRFKLDYNGSGNAKRDWNWWCPIKGNKVINGEGPIRVQELLGWQYYVALEFFSPGSANLTAEYTGEVILKTYFKDAT